MRGYESWDLAVFNRRGTLLYGTTIGTPYVREYLEHIDRVGFYDRKEGAYYPKRNMAMEPTYLRITIIVDERERKEEILCQM